MFETKKSQRKLIIVAILVAVCFIVFFILNMTIRKNIFASGGELFILIIPLIICLFFKTWELFMETCFPKDTMFEDYFNEYFTGKDMLEDKSSK